MFGRWIGAWRTRREAAAVQRRAIPDDLWKRTLVRYPFLRRCDAADGAELRRLTSLFLDRKEFTCTGGLKLTDVLAVSVAAQAVLPVLRLGLHRYDGFVGLVIHSDAVVAPREVQDDDGIVHAYDEELAGEAMEGGPVMLAWPDVRRAGHSTEQGYNVVIHEFAHVLDMAHGGADGMPELPSDLSPTAWRKTLGASLDALQARVDTEQSSAIDPYGAQGPEELFAVASELFFVNPAALQGQDAALYALLQRFYRQDPLTETARR